MRNILIRVMAFSVEFTADDPDFIILNEYAVTNRSIRVIGIIKSHMLICLLTGSENGLLGN